MGDAVRKDREDVLGTVRLDDLGLGYDSVVPVSKLRAILVRVFRVMRKSISIQWKRHHVRAERKTMWRGEENHFEKEG